LPLGKIVVIADKHSLFDNPKHPYTKALLSAIPIPDPDKKKERIVLRGDVPSPIDPPSGCRFHTRCPFATAKCKVDVPELRTTESMKPGHEAACHYIEEIESGERQPNY
ncbi:MAG: peptide ABC transporter ATP-binding protein, partial [Planococcus sp. (in: Bacteria)]|nr:peptide ABC transporter ATP-binding protein [Planococcus sp. (in: firmicutes)]